MPAVPAYAILVVLAIAAVAIGTSLWRTGRSGFQRFDVPLAVVPGAEDYDRAYRRRTLVSLAAGIVVFCAVLALNEAVSSAYGVVIALAPGAAATVALVIFGALSRLRASEPAGTRSADLVPRAPRDYIPRWGLALPAIAAVTSIAFYVAAGLSSRPDETGLYRAVGFELVHGQDRYGSAATPYPGWYYGLPLIAMTLALVAATVFALYRIAGAPRPTMPSLREVDDRARVMSTRVVMKVSSGALLTYFGAILATAGTTTVTAATFWNIRDAEGTDQILVQPAATIGAIEAAGGGVIVLVGLALLFLAVRDAAWVPTSSSIAVRTKIRA